MIQSREEFAAKLVAAGCKLVRPVPEGKWIPTILHLQLDRFKYSLELQAHDSVAVYRIEGSSRGWIGSVGSQVPHSQRIGAYDGFEVEPVLERCRQDNAHGIAKAKAAPAEFRAFLTEPCYRCGTADRPAFETTDELIWVRFERVLALRGDRLYPEVAEPGADCWFYLKTTRYNQSNLDLVVDLGASRYCPISLYAYADGAVARLVGEKVELGPGDRLLIQACLREAVNRIVG